MRRRDLFAGIAALFVAVQLPKQHYVYRVHRLATAWYLTGERFAHPLTLGLLESMQETSEEFHARTLNQAFDAL